MLTYCRVLLLSLACLILIGCVTAASRTQASVRHSPAECPRVDLGETAEDCPWAGIARVLSEGEVNGEKLMQESPALARQLEADKKAGALKALWGQSLNFDEAAKGEIVAPKILKAIAEDFGGEAQGRVVHAGMEHTYGYLFSNLKTPFGYKRARWVRNTLERGFGLPDGLLGPNPSEGTLFANVSTFFGLIAFQGAADKEELASLRKEAHLAARAVRSFDIKKLTATRLEETVVVGGKKVVLRTDIIPFIQPVEGEKNSHLLVYSVRDGRTGKAQLVTGFPVEASFGERVFDPSGLGENRPISTRYNAVVEGVTGQKLSGLRRKVEVSHVQ